MDFEDIMKVQKFWRIFKSLKNFKSGGLRVKFKSVAGVFALGFTAISYVFFGEIGAEELDLTAQDISVQQACLANHKQFGMHFQGRISNEAGCGCTAKMVTASLEEKHFDLWAQAHSVMLYNYEQEWTVQTEVQKEQFEKNKKQMYDTLKGKFDVPPKLYSEMIVGFEEIDEVCDNETTYSEENITQVASLRPMGYQSDVALASLPITVEEGVVEIRLRGASAPIKTASK